MSRFISKLVSVPSAVFAFARQRITRRARLVGFVTIILAVFVFAAWGLSTGQAPDPEQFPVPELASGDYLPPDESISADDILPADLDPPELSESPASSVPEPLALSEPLASPDSEPAALPEPPASSAPAVKARQNRDNRVSSLLASRHARAVYSGTVNGKRRVKVEFLTRQGTVSDVYSEDALLRHGWKMSLNLDGRKATLKNTGKVYVVPLVDHSSSKNAYAKKQTKTAKSKTRTAQRSRLTSTGDHLGVSYMKFPRR